MRLLARGAVLLLTAPLLLTVAWAGTIHLAWDPVPGATGYRVYYGTESGRYTDVADVGNTAEVSLGDLADCRSYYIAVKAYNGHGESPGYSNEVVGWPRPTITPATSVAVQGSQIVLEIHGSNFREGAEVLLDAAAVPRDAGDNPLVVFESLDIVDCDLIQALVSVEPTATDFQAMRIGELPLPLEVVHADGVYNTGAVSLDVQFNPDRADLNRDQARTVDRVDGDDLASFTRSWGSTPGDDAFDFDCDLDGDTDVDGDDLALLATVFGRCRSDGTWSVEACL